MEKRKEINISGNVKIKRKRFWADRYAEIQNNVFFYFKSKGDINARGVIQLKGSVVQEKAEKSNEKIIVIINPNSGDKQNETIQLKIENEAEHKEWLKQLVSSSKVVNPFENIENTNTIPMNSSINNKTLFSKSSLNVIDSNTEKNFEVGANPNQYIGNTYTLIDSEFIKKNQGENINRLKSNVSNYINEKSGDDFTLFENHSNMRMFQKRIRTNKTLFTELSQISVYLNKIVSSIKTLQQNLGNFNFYIFLVIASVIFFLTFYLILEVTNNNSFFLSLAFSMNLLLFPIIYTKIAKTDIRSILHDEKLFSEKYLESAEFKIKVIMGLPMNINDALCILTNHSQRKFWHPNISFLSESNVQDEKVIKAAYKLNGKVIFQEKFVQTIYKEKEFIYVVEHFQNAIFRVFLIKLNKKSNFHLLKFFSVVNSLSLEEMNPAYSPMMLNGLSNFYNELKIDTTSFLHEYYKKNKYLLTDEEDDEEVDNDDTKSEIIPIHKERLSKNVPPSEETKRNSTPMKMGSSIVPNESINNNNNNNNNVSEIKSKAKKPILPANASDAMKGYYEQVEKVIDFLVKTYELTDANGWNLIDTKDNCTIHTKIDAETGLTISRGETKIEKDRDTIRLCIDNLEKKSEYDGMFAEGRFLERPCEGFSISYQKFKGVFPVGPRDFVLSGAYLTTENDLLVMGATSIEYPEFPPVKGVTRGHLFYGGWVLEKISETTTRTVFMNLSDPKGSIPKKILEYAAKNQALCPAGVRKKVEKK